MKHLTLTLAAWLLLFGLASAQPATGYASATPDNPTSGSADGETGFTFIVDLANLPTAWWTAADDADATKGRVYRDDGTQLAADWIDFSDSGTSGSGFVRFKDDMAASASTYRIYPPVSGNSTTAASATYGSDNAYDANWIAYYPLSNVNDRTANGRNMTANNTPTSGVSGQVGNAYDFDAASSENMAYDEGSNMATFPFTVLAWYASDDLNIDNEGIAGITGDATFETEAFVARYGTTDGTIARINTAEDTGGTVTTGFHHYGGVFTSSTVELFEDGTGTGSATSHSETIADSSVLRIATENGARWYGDGVIDEVQFHDVARSDEWIGEEYLQTNDNAAYWNTWTWNAAGGSGSLLLRTLLESQ